MNLKVYGNILLIMSIFLIFGGSSIQFLDTFKEDRQRTIELDKIVDHSYKEITNEMKQLHQSMTEMQELFSLYYENIGENKNYYEGKFIEIKNQKKSIEEQVEVTRKSCQKTVNSNSQKKCKSLEINTNMAQENYVKLEQNYEQLMEGHEEWLKKNRKVAMN